VFVKVCLRSQGREAAPVYGIGKNKRTCPRDRNAEFPMAARLPFHNVGVFWEEGAEVLCFFGFCHKQQKPLSWMR